MCRPLCFYLLYSILSGVYILTTILISIAINRPLCAWSPRLIGRFLSLSRHIKNMGSNESRTTSTTSPALATPASSPPSFDKAQDLYGGAVELQRDLLALLARLGSTREGGGGGGGGGESDSRARDNNAIRTNEEEAHVHLQHIVQQANWDCGVACLQMILAYTATAAAAASSSSSSPPYPPPTRDALLAQAGTQSIWTVDLLFLLQQYINETQRTVFFTTMAPGVCSHYSTLAYYNKGGQFAIDRDRVLRLFCTAKGEGLRIYEGRVSWECLRDLLRTGKVLIILLVNQKLLPSSLSSSLPPSSSSSAPPLQEQQQQQHQHQRQQPVAPAPSTSTSISNSSDTTTLTATAPPPPSPSLSTTYCGHYILLTGFRPASSSLPSLSFPSSSSEGFFIYKDPAKPPPPVSSTLKEEGGREDGREEGLGGDFLISVAALEEARKAEGTDEDVLVVEV